MKNWIFKRTLWLAAAFLISAGLAAPTWAAPVANQIVPVAIYLSTPAAFGLAFDSGNNLIHYTQGDFGDNLVHNLKPFNAYTAAELAALTDIGGVKQISLAEGLHDAAGTTDPGAEVGGTSVHFDSLAYDAATGQLVSQGGANRLQAFDPFTAANLDADYRAGSANDGFSDGLDIDGANTWYSGDVQSIYNNGVLIVDKTNAGQTTVPGWTGLGGVAPNGYSGVEQVGDRIFAVSVHDNADAGQSRTIVSFDLAGNMLTYDPDGDLVAARWEDLAFDGRYLYAADLRGNSDGRGVDGDIYVFDIVGPGGLNGVPEPSTILLLGSGLLGLGWFGRKRMKS